MEMDMKRKRSYEVVSPGQSHETHWVSQIASTRNPEQNQRRHLRKPLPMESTICQCVTCFGRWPLRDVSMGGAFVEMPSRGMLIGMAVDVALHFRLHGSLMERRLFAQIMRVEPAGVALVFNHYGPEVHADLATLLNAD